MRTLPKKAFTLIEMVIVVVIVGIIASIVLPEYTKAVERNYSKEAKTNLKLIAAAQQQYYMENRHYFPNTQGTTYSDLSGINDVFHLSIQDNRLWLYEVHSVGSSPITQFSVSAQRVTGPYAGCSYLLSGSKSSRVTGEPYSPGPPFNTPCP